MSKHEFAIIVEGELRIYDKYEDIPEKIDNVIRFLPYCPPEPHTEEQHQEISSWNVKFKELMKRERKNASSV